MLMLGSALPNMANICLKKFSGGNFYPFTERDEGFSEEFEELLLLVLLSFSHGKQFLIICKPIVGINASQLYLYLMCQSMLTAFYMNWDLDSQTPRQNKIRRFKKMVMSYFQRKRPR